MAQILVIDLGTTYFKFALFERTGRMRTVLRLAPPLRTPRPGWLELESHAFAALLAEGIAELAQDDPSGLAGVEAVSFATQTNSFLLLDGEDRPLTPLVLWPDRRAEGLEEEVQHRVGVPQFTATTGIPGVSHQFMLAKLRWFQQQEPTVWQRVRRLCLISDYFGLLLTGQHVTEAGAAALTGLVDVPQRRWWPAMLQRCELEAAWLPEIVQAGTDLGPVLPEIAELWGLPRACRVVVGCLDQYAGAIGVGNVLPGGVSETTGTVLATVRCSEQFGTDLGAAVFQGPGYREGLYYQMAFGDLSANYLEWYRNLLPDRPEAAELVQLIATVPPGADGLRLDTGRPPSTPEEVFVGLPAGQRPTRAQAVRAILETVAAALRDQVELLCGGHVPSELCSAGGAARSEHWLQIKANVLGIPMRATRCAEPTSLGAALLAEAALSGARVPELVNAWVERSERYQPNIQRSQLYETLYPRPTACP